MNLIQKALDEVKFRINDEVLKIVFKPKNGPSWNSVPISMDERIMAAVIRPRVLIDANLVGGTETMISLDGLEGDRSDEFTIVYRIPKSRTQGRSILSVTNVTFTSMDALTYAGANSSMTGGSTLMKIGQAIMDAQGSIPNISTAKVQLIGENVIMVKEAAIIPGYCFLRCLLGSDEHMSHIQLRSYHHFCKLVELAVKSYIYNNQIVLMDMGQLVGGQMLGAIKAEIEKYSDSEELYQTYLREKWTKVSLMNDSESFNRHIRKMVGGMR